MPGPRVDLCICTGYYKEPNGSFRGFCQGSTRGHDTGHQSGDYKGQGGSIRVARKGCIINCYDMGYRKRNWKAPAWYVRVCGSGSSAAQVLSAR